MTLQEFNEKLDVLKVKAGMREDVFWPIVYDEDELGEILIREDGQIWFADKHANWVESRMSVEDVTNIRYKRYETPNRSERNIFVNFTSGDFIKIHNWKKNSIVYTDVYMAKTEENAAFVDELKTACECYDNNRGNTFYITIRKTAK